MPFLKKNVKVTKTQSQRVPKEIMRSLELFQHEADELLNSSYFNTSLDNSLEEPETRQVYSQLKKSQLESVETDIRSVINMKVVSEIDHRVLQYSQVEIEDLNNSFNSELASCFKFTPEEIETTINVHNIPVYVLCDRCNKTRYLKNCKDPLELPDKWYCYMNPNKKYNKCGKPEEQTTLGPEVHLINNLYTAGSVVWVKIEGYPWWPGMVDDDPLVDFFYKLDADNETPTSYHVLIFDSEHLVSRWFTPDKIKGYRRKSQNLNRVPKRYMKQLTFAIKQANLALKKDLIDRLRHFGFLARFNQLPGELISLYISQES